MFWTIVIVLTATWIFGAILAVVIMAVINVIVFGRNPQYAPYSIKEFVFGFIGSWATVIVVSKMLTDDF